MRRAHALSATPKVELVFFWGGGGDTDRQGRGLTKHLGSCVIRETTQTGRPWSRPGAFLYLAISIYLSLG